MARLPENEQYTHKESTTIPVPKLPEKVTAQEPQREATPAQPPRDPMMERAKRQRDRGLLLGGISSALSQFSSALPERSRRLSSSYSVLNSPRKVTPQAIADAIKKVESGGDYNSRGASGEFGAYQFMPSTWSEWAKEYLGDSNAPMTKENQDKVALAKISSLMDKGYGPKEVALIWNGGSPVVKRGTNKKGVKYDSGAYAAKVLSQLGALGYNYGDENRQSNIERFRSYGNITTRYGGSTPLTQNHRGIDIAAGYGAPIRPFVSGTVEKVVTGKKRGDEGYGNYVIIKDKNGNLHYYSHLANAWVNVGDRVDLSTILGQEGNSGQTFSAHGGTGSHLHYEIRDAFNRRLNPETFKMGE